MPSLSNRITTLESRHSPDGWSAVLDTMSDEQLSRLERVLLAREAVEPGSTSAERRGEVIDIPDIEAWLVALESEVV